MFNLKAILIASAMSALITSSATGYYVSKYWQYKADSLALSMEKAKTLALGENIRAIVAAAAADRATYEVNEGKLKELEDEAKRLRDKISDGVGLTGPDVDGVRTYFDGPTSKAKPRRRTR